MLSKNERDNVIQNLIIKASNLSICDVISNEGITLRGRGVNKQAQSPFRTSQKFSSFTISETLNIWTDWVLKEDGYCGGTIRFIEKLYGYNFTEALKYLSYKYGLDSTSVLEVVFGTKYREETIEKIKKKIYVQKEYIKPKLADVETRNKVYKIFIEFCKLYEDDKKYLKERMKNDFEKYSDLFFTMPTKKRLESFNNFILEKKCTVEDFEHVPGFYIKNNKVCFNTIKGIGIAIKNEREKIVGIQVRTTNKNLRYLWFSSTNFIEEKGASSGSPAAIFPKCIKNHKNWIFITEGVFKAVAINSRYNARTISVQGVGNISGAIEVIKKSNVKMIYIAYDADIVSNETVKLQLFKLKNRIEALKINAKILTWDEKYGKGIDDVIYSGFESKIHVLEEKKEENNGVQ